MCCKSTSQVVIYPRSVVQFITALDGVLWITRVGEEASWARACTSGVRPWLIWNITTRLAQRAQHRHTFGSGRCFFCPSLWGSEGLLSLSALQWTLDTDARTLRLPPTAQLKDRHMKKMNRLLKSHSPPALLWSYCGVWEYYKLWNTRTSALCVAQVYKLFLFYKEKVFFSRLVSFNLQSAINPQSRTTVWHVNAHRVRAVVVVGRDAGWSRKQ